MFHYLVQCVLFAHFVHAWCDVHTSYDFSGSTCFSLFQGNVQTLKGQEIFILFLIFNVVKMLLGFWCDN